MKNMAVLLRCFLCALLATASAGDTWYPIATVELRNGDDPVLRLVSKGLGALCADAIMVSSTARYNDGSPAKEVLLGPFDGIILVNRK